MCCNKPCLGILKIAYVDFQTVSQEFKRHPRAEPDKITYHSKTVQNIPRPLNQIVITGMPQHSWLKELRVQSLRSEENVSLMEFDCDFRELTLYFDRPIVSKLSIYMELEASG